MRQTTRLNDKKQGNPGSEENVEKKETREPLYYVCIFTWRNIRHFGYSREEGGAIAHLDYITKNMVKQKFTYKEILEYMPRWKRVWAAEHGRGYKIFIEPVEEPVVHTEVTG